MDKATGFYAGGPEFEPPRKPFFAFFKIVFYFSFFKFFIPGRDQTLKPLRLDESAQ